MPFIHQGQLYLKRDHIDALKSESEETRAKYQAVATVLLQESNFSSCRAAKSLNLSTRQFNRIFNRFRTKGIAGLHHGSRRPHNSPYKPPMWVEDLVVKVRERTGFGSEDLSVIINRSMEFKGLALRLKPKRIYRILVRRGAIEAERRAIIEWKHFEWGHPNRLIQADLTNFNGHPILTTEDDHSRRGWALRLANAKDKTVVRGLEKLLKMRYDNLLTDNGSQFSRKNHVMKKYCEKNLDGKHIWSSIHHPQTLGKLSAFQKSLKRFLFHSVGSSSNRKLIDHFISVFIHWYNNGRYHRGIKNYPEVRYSGKRDEDWYTPLVKGLNLEDLLILP